ncbi:MAG: DUF1501 domain-containing protein, partial [Pirellulales bacterium]|nr:DUF1501 domain-containing protein [Pirellulales bacterium]
MMNPDQFQETRASMSAGPRLRRQFFSRLGHGLAGAALMELVGGEMGHAANTTGGERRSKVSRQHDLASRIPHVAPRARSVIQLFMHGGPSQMDLLDPKPALSKYDSQKFPGVIDVQQPEQAGGILKSPFQFARYGESGIQVSEIMPQVAGCVDELCVVRSMWT